MTELQEKIREFHCRVQECKNLPTDAYLLRGFFKNLIEMHWENGANHGRYQGQLGCYKIRTKENPKGDLTIKMNYEDDPQNPNPVPSIIIVAGNTSIQKQVIGNLADFRADPKTDNKLPSKTQIKGWMASCPMIFSHRWDNGEDALIAAQSTLEFLAGFQDDIMKTMGLSLCEPKGMSTPKKPEQGVTGYYQVDVGLDLQYNFTMSVASESHIVKTFASDLTAE
jgi:hypothetical protein